MSYFPSLRSLATGAQSSQIEKASRFDSTSFCSLLNEICIYIIHIYIYKIWKNHVNIQSLESTFLLLSFGPKKNRKKSKKNTSPAWLVCNDGPLGIVQRKACENLRLRWSCRVGLRNQGFLITPLISLWNNLSETHLFKKNGPFIGGVITWLYFRTISGSARRALQLFWVLKNHLEHLKGSLRKWWNTWDTEIATSCQSTWA